jgi:UDP-N-acetylmuramoyl-L-alanyl-D-glutamate--2,6-diaminopimelate ligase
LFSHIVAADGAAVINVDADHADTFHAVARDRGLRVLSVGTTGREVILHAANPDAGGQILDIEALGVRRRVRLPLPAAFQAANALLAVGLAVACGAAPDVCLEGLEGLHGIAGRLQNVGRLANGAEVYVDYAHTPDALLTVLSALRPHVRGRLHVVFGCGGDRDRGKRPEMGAAAATAERVIVTDDNPRGEDAAEIRRQALVGCPHGEDIGDRRTAIAAAIAGLEAGDVLVVAGKGHETGQIIGTEVKPFDDAVVVRQS